MAIRQIVSRSIQDNSVATTDLNSAVSLGGGFFQGESNGGSNTTGKGHIFRVHDQKLDNSVTIASGDNALASGPLEISTTGTVNLTVLGNLTIV